MGASLPRVPRAKRQGAQGAGPLTHAVRPEVGTLRITLVARGNPLDPQSVAGKKAVPLGRALARRYPVSGVNDVQLRGLERALVAALTARPDGAEWRQRFALSATGFRLQSRTARRILRRARVDGIPSLGFQFNGLFQAGPGPYVVYTDTTFAATSRRAPDLIPVGARAASRWRALEERLYHDAEHVFAQSRQTAQSLTDDYGVPSARVTTVLAGANFPSLPSRESLPGSPTILFVGRDADRKGLPDLLAAFSTLRRSRPHLSLHIVGPTDIPTAAGIVAHGYVSDRAVIADLYTRASVFCLPSRWEPFGLAAAEAMAFSVPCVVTRAGGLPEVIGDAGLVVAPNDPDALAEALGRILDDDALALRLGRAGRDRVASELTWDRVVDRMAPALSEIERRISS